MQSNQFTLHPLFYKLWQNPEIDNVTKYYEYKIPPHGAQCLGCGKCAHCPTENTNAHNNHLHGMWRENMTVLNPEIPLDNVKEWRISSETYVSDGGYLSSINIYIFPAFSESLPNRDANIIATAKTYFEILQKYEDYLHLAIRKEKARVMK